MQNSLSQFFSRIGARLTQPVFSGTGGLGGWRWLSDLWRNGFDYRREAGNLWESSIPLACLKWEQRASSEVEIVAQRRDASGDWVTDAAHPAYPLLTNPNPFFDTHQLLNALRMDYHLDGNAYLWKARSGSGQVVQLWWVPCWMIEPCWQEDGDDFITCYQYRANGKDYALPVTDIIHFRNGIAPESHGRKGLSDFHAVLREVCTDNEGSVFGAALLRNMGVPGVIISPKAAAGGGAQNLTKAQRSDFKEQWTESFTGERRGEPFVQSIPIDITMPGFSPQQLLLDKIRQIPEERISAAFGIPAVVLGLGAGLQHASAKSSFADARAQAYDSCVIPTLYEFARALTRQLMADFGDVNNERIWFDLSDVGALQPDQDALFVRISAAYLAGWLKRSEARELAGYESGPEDDIYAPPKALPPGNEDPAAPDDNEDPDPDEELKTIRRELAARWAKATKELPA